MAALAPALKLYGWYTSSCTRRALLALFEKGVEGFKFEVVSLPKGEQHAPAYVQKQPFHKVPLLVDGDFCLFESRAISRYIAGRFKDSGTELLGSTPEEQALVDQWLDVEAGMFNPAVVPMWQMKAPSSGQPRSTEDQAKAAELKALLDRTLQVYEKHLEHNEYLAGAKYSLADLSHVASAAKFLAACDPDATAIFTSRPNVMEWFRKISERPAWRQVLELTAQ